MQREGKLIISVAVAAFIIFSVFSIFPEGWDNLGEIVNGYNCYDCGMYNDNNCAWKDGTFGIGVGDKKCVYVERTCYDGKCNDPPLNANTCKLKVYLDTGELASAEVPYSNKVCWFTPDDFGLSSVDGARRDGFEVRLSYQEPEVIHPEQPPEQEPECYTVYDCGDREGYDAVCSDGECKYTVAVGGGGTTEPPIGNEDMTQTMITILLIIFMIASAVVAVWIFWRI